MKPICTKCGCFIGLYDAPLFFIGSMLLSLQGIDGKFVCSKCSRKEVATNKNDSTNPKMEDV